MAIGLQNTRRRFRRRIALTCTALFALLFAAVPTASAGGGGTEADPAAIGPTLGILEFGSATGLGLTCPTAAGLASAAIDEADAGDAGALVEQTVSQATSACVDAGRSGAERLTVLRSRLAPLAAANPALDPALETLAAAAMQLAEDYEDEVAPFGPTLETLAEQIRFLMGSG